MTAIDLADAETMCAISIKSYYLRRRQALLEPLQAASGKAAERAVQRSEVVDGPRHPILPQTNPIRVNGYDDPIDEEA